MSMKMFWFLLATSFAMTGCGDGLKSPSNAFLMPKEQMAVVVRDANHGDLSAIKRLIAHYEASSGNDVVAEEWRAKARALGDAQELYYYAARMFTEARGEPNLVKKREMLVEALESAKRSYASSAEASTQQLIDEITRAIDRAGRVD